MPIWLAAGGPKSAALAARQADGIVTSVKDPAVTIERVLDPARRAAEDAGRPAPQILATRWSVLAGSEDEAWEALHPWRGLRAPGRLEAVDPADLRERADHLPREEILGRYSIVSDSDEIVETYRPLVETCAADVVAVQMASVDQVSLIKMLGEEVLPRTACHRRK